MTPTQDESKPPEDDFEKFFRVISKAYQPTEFRSNVKLWGSGILALSLWVLLGFIAWSHFQSSKEFALKLAELSPKLEEGQISLVDQERVQLIEKANGLVDSTANRLYTFLTPIVTAVTGYFFVASSAIPREGQRDSGSGGSA
jgi:hypothetical protein